MLNDFKEWISDNLRYILLVLAGILILVIAFFAIRLVTGLGSPDEKAPETEITTEAETETEPVQAVEQQLEKNVPEILGLVEKYYTARLDKDYETLASICENFDETMQAQVESEDAAVESYSNFMTYSKPGLTEGSYIVYIYVETKLTGIETPAPSLLEKYVLPDPEGNLIIAETSRSEEVLEYTKLRQADDDVQALIVDVTTAFENAKAADEDLKNFVDAQSTGEPQDGTTSGEDSGDEASGTVSAATGTMQTTTEVNVRGSASADATLYGSLPAGYEVEVLENLDIGWSKVRYVTNGTTIEGYMMTQYLGPVQ